MAEEMNTPTVDILLEQIEELKGSTVSKDKYDSVVEDYRKMAEAFMNGQTIDKEEAPEAPVDGNNILNELVMGDTKHSNLDYVVAALEAREALIKAGIDPNMPFGPKAEYTENDAEQTEYIAKILQECVDRAEGDPASFNIALNSVLVDNLPNQAKKRR